MGENIKVSLLLPASGTDSVSNMATANSVATV